MPDLTTYLYVLVLVRTANDDNDSMHKSSCIIMICLTLRLLSTVMIMAVSLYTNFRLRGLRTYTVAVLRC